METMTSLALCQATGITERNLHHWTTHRIIQPETASNPGSGMQRRWAITEVSVVRAVALLRGLGAPLPVCGRMAVALRLLGPDEWVGRVYVDDLGRVGHRVTGAACWVIDLGRCAAPLPVAV